MGKQVIIMRAIFALLVLTGGAMPLFGQTEYEILTGAAETSSTLRGYQLNTIDHDCRVESVYLKSELNAVGIVGNVPISAISFKCAGLPGKNLENTRIRMKHTTATTLTTGYESGYTDCFGPVTIARTAFTIGQWYKFTFTTPFIWDGTSNIVVDYSIDGTNWAFGGGCYVRAVAGNRSCSGYSDSNQGAFPFNPIMGNTLRASVPSIKMVIDGLGVITPAALPSTDEGIPYSIDIQASQGTPPYTWTHVSGALPPSTTGTMTLNQVSGSNGDEFRLAGTPAIGSGGTYSFVVEVTDGSKTSQKTMSLFIMPQPAAMPFNDDFGTDKGWQLGAGWDTRAAIGYNASSPTRSEPSIDHSPSSDNKILGHIIGGDYAANMSSTVWATMPPVDCSNATTVGLRYYRWMGINFLDNAKVQVTNNGTTWTDIWTSSSSQSLNESAWTFVGHDITAEAAGHAVVQVRFGIGPTSGTVNTGWCIDDVEIVEPGPELEVREGGAPGAMITDNEANGGLRDFGQVSLSTTSQALVLTFFNNGLSDITFGLRTYNGPAANSDGFTITVDDVSNQVLAPGSSFTMEVVFWSSTLGVFTDIIQIPHNAAGSGTTPFEINLRAEAVGTASVIQVDLSTSGGTNIPHNDPAAGTARDFGTVAAGASSTPITIAITNSGTGTLDVTAIQMGGTYWMEYEVIATLPMALTSGQSATFTVAFKPSGTYLGLLDATVWLTHNAAGSTTTYDLPVQGTVATTAPVVVVNDGASNIAHDAAASGPRDFGQKMLNTTSTITITVSNTGGGVLNANTLTLGGANANQFSISGTGFGPTIAINGNSTFTISFTPTTIGIKNAIVTFSHNDTNVTSPFVINITGEGVTTPPTAPIIEVRETDANGTVITNPGAATGILDFGTQDVANGATSAAVIYVENTGTAVLTLGTPVFNPTGNTEFSITTNGWPTSLAIGASATFSITFDPTQNGVQNGVIEFTHNDTAAGSPFRLNVTGTGASPVIAVKEGSTTGAAITSGSAAVVGGGRDLGSIDVSAGATGPTTVSITNTGSVTLTLGAVTKSGANSGDFSVVTTGMASTLAPNASTSFTVTFDPTLGGIKDAQVQFTNNDPNGPSPFIVHILGTAVDPAGVTITTTSLPAGDSGTVYPTTTLVAVNGSGTLTWSLYSGTLPAGLSLSTAGVISGTPTSLATTVNNFTVRVSDTSGATYDRALTLTVAGSLTVPLDGNGSSCSASNSSSSIWLALLGILCAIVAARRVNALKQ